MYISLKIHKVIFSNDLQNVLLAICREIYRLNVHFNHIISTGCTIQFLHSLLDENKIIYTVNPTVNKEWITHKLIYNKPAIFFVFFSLWCTVCQALFRYKKSGNQEFFSKKSGGYQEFFRIKSDNFIQNYK